MVDQRKRRDANPTFVQMVRHVRYATTEMHDKEVQRLTEMSDDAMTLI